MNTILTPEDSRRVADAMIEKIEDSDFDVAEAVRDAVLGVLIPSVGGWKADWFPLTIADMCDEIRRGIVAAAYQAAEDE